MRRTLGLEIELLLTDPVSGRLVDEADWILPVVNEESGAKRFVPEAGYDMVELNSKPSDSLATLDASVRADLAALEQAGGYTGVMTIPASSAEHHDHAKRGDKARYFLNPSVFGNGDALRGYELVNAYGSCAGTHLHISQEPGRVPEQHKLMTAIDPAGFVLLSASPFIHGQYLGPAARTSLIRNHIFKEAPSVIGQLQPYIKDLEDIAARSDEAHAHIKGIVGEHPEADEAYKKDNSSWGPLRVRDGIGTIEARNGDANLSSLVMAHAALYKGVMQYVFDQGRKAVVGNNTSLTTHPKTNPDLLVLPYFRGVQGLEQAGIKRGLESESVHDYISKIVGMAYEGLSEEERAYLQPYQIMLTGRQTLADVISDQFGRDFQMGDRISEVEARALMLQFSELYRQDLENPAATLELLEYGCEALPPLRVEQPITYVPMPSSMPIAPYQVRSPAPQSQPRAA